MLMKIINWLFRNYKRINHFDIRGFTGAIKDKIDKRDFSIGSISIDLPSEVNLKEYVVEVKSQGTQNSCVAFSICSAIEFQLQLENPQRTIPLSERYSYYYGRKKSNLFPKNDGMYPRDAIKSAKTDGVSIERLCKYDNRYMNKEPGIVAKSIAHIYSALIKSYFRAFSSINIKEQLAIGLPVIIAVPLYDYWINNKTGNIRLPKSTDKKLGYHAVLVVGYFDNYFICLNSYGKYWGNKGFCYIPMNYKRTDSWVIELR